MKKGLSLVLVLAMTAALLAGCSSNGTETTAATTTEAPATTEAATEAPATEAPAATEGALKTGYAIVGGYSSSSADAGDSDGLAQSDFTAAAVLVDENGVIVDCVIDVAQNKINFSAEGKLVTTAGTELLSKQELLEDYGMKDISPIGKEWYEQADALADFVIGKTADEVAAAVGDDGKASDADLAAGCTITITDMIEAVVNATNNAKALGAQSGDKIGLGLVTVVSSSSADATSDADGLAQADTTYAVVSTNAEGVVTSCIVDVTQAKVNFDASGVITSDLAAAVVTKADQKEDYGMKGISPIGKEWYEQAEAFDTFMVGKTADDVAAVGMDESGYPTDADLTAGCTMNISDMSAAVAKAIANAQ